MNELTGFQSSILKLAKQYEEKQDYILAEFLTDLIRVVASYFPHAPLNHTQP